MHDEAASGTMDFIVDWLAPIGSGLISLFFLAVATAARLVPFNFPFKVAFFSCSGYGFTCSLKVDTARRPNEFLVLTITTLFVGFLCLRLLWVAL